MQSTLLSLYLEQVVHLLGYLHVQARVGEGKDNLH
jgi:hypothetical protein